MSRAELEARYGQVWTKEELLAEFIVDGFGGGFCVVVEKATGRRGSLSFQHSPRFYFGFLELKR